MVLAWATTSFLYEEVNLRPNCKVAVPCEFWNKSVEFNRHNLRLSFSGVTNLKSSEKEQNIAR
jgi:hypothetical protein